MDNIVENLIKKKKTINEVQMPKQCPSNSGLFISKVNYIFNI